MNRIKKILTYFFSLLTILLFILTFMILIIGIKSNKENKIVQIFGYSYSAVPTDSMEPTIKIGDVIISKAIDYQEVKVGDIAVFYSEQKKVYIVHRVIDILDNGNLQTKGDNPKASVDSEEVTEEKFVGIVVQRIPNIGNFVLKYRNVLFILIISTFIYIIVIEIRNIIRNINDKKKEDLLIQQSQKYEELKEKIKEEMSSSSQDEDKKNDNYSPKMR